MNKKKLGVGTIIFFIATSLTGVYHHEGLYNTSYQMPCGGYKNLEQKIDIDAVQLPSTASVVTLFVPGYGSGYTKGLEYVLAGYFPDADSGHPNALHIMDFGDSQEDCKRQYSYLGQDKDIARLASRYVQLVSEGYRVRLFGVSRGAATIINFMGTHTTKNVVSVNVECPFDTLETVLSGGLVGSIFTFSLGKKRTIEWVHKYIAKNYDLNGINPIDVAHKIQHSVPLFFVHGLSDPLTPSYCTHRLVCNLRNAGHPAVESLFIKTDKPRHSSMAFSKEAQVYRERYHAFISKLETAAQ